MTYTAARKLIPEDAELSSTFGYPSEGGYTEFWRRADGDRWMVSNGTYLDTAPFTWICQKVVERT